MLLPVLPRGGAHNELRRRSGAAAAGWPSYSGLLRRPRLYRDREVSFARVPGQYRLLRAESRTQAGGGPGAGLALDGDPGADHHGCDRDYRWVYRLQRPGVESAGDCASHAQPDSHHYRVQSLFAVCLVLADVRRMAGTLGPLAARFDLLRP